METTTDEQWDAMMDINMRAPFRLMRTAADRWANRKDRIDGGRHLT